ncbi:hypothetical protein [Nocardia mangyaensis]|uniref:hypothetical protein n=1 Tax=Nocardia mangyaensis TaxID=2213200 RepID=UPI002676A817|nr:hypothetical protein [Nocardia mangyaensis]MDO3651264.1 hypothetical protein [Nocardia mangyaensis]
MRKLLGTALVGGAVAAAGLTATGVANASPPPPSPVCSIATFPLILLIEATGGTASPFAPVVQSIGDAVCH